MEEAGLRRERIAPWELRLADRVAVARRLSARGVKANEIARELGVAAATVHKYMRAGTCPACQGRW